MVDKLSKPRSGPAWLRWVEGELASLRSAIISKNPPPIGAMVPYAGGGAPPPGWLTANGATFSGTTYPLLAHRLGSTTLPNPAAAGGAGWIIRAS